MQAGGCGGLAFAYCLACRGQGRLHTERRLCGDAFGQPECLGQQFLAGHHFLNQAQAIGFVGIKLVAGEQPAHGVAPAGALVHAQGGATKGEDAALHFHLGEAGIAGAQVDIRGQHQLDADGVAVALGRDYHRLAHPWPAKHAPGVAAVCWDLPAGGKLGRHIGQVQPGGKVLALGEHQGYPGLAVTLELAIGAAQVVEHGHIEGVALARSLQTDQHDPAAFFAADTAAVVLRHGMGSFEVCNPGKIGGKRVDAG